MSHSTIISVSAPNRQHMATSVDNLPCDGSLPALSDLVKIATLDQADVLDIVTEDLGVYLGNCEEVPSIEAADVSRSSSDVDISKDAAITVVKRLDEDASESNLQEALVVQEDVHTSITPSSDSEDSDDDDDDDMYIPRGFESQGTRISTKPGVGSPTKYAKPVFVNGPVKPEAQNVPQVPPPSLVQAQREVSASAARSAASQPDPAFESSLVQSRSPPPGLTIGTIPSPGDQFTPSQAAASNRAAPPHPSVDRRPLTAPSRSRSLFSKLKRVFPVGRRTEQTGNGGTSSTSPSAAAQVQNTNRKTRNHGGL
ncbi:hypothetical protein ONZ51_g8907 [Trametes cubensis]|uniref:Uncharacterized protein n=1 Tax=Trametes cubensis TaxID=1111947 RepID=A0AAD7X8U3_9APHY|nr:hypothetical protein ONZ51_g8907 [Trametes cubensis]